MAKKLSTDYNPAERPRTATDKAFRISLYGKGLDGLLETLGGILLLLVSPNQINHLARWLTQGELSQDPHDFIAHHILKTAHHLTGSSLVFGAAYLLSHGLVKVFLVFMVLRDKIWAYLALIGVTGLFVIYQLYRLIVDKFSVSLLLLTLFDLLIIYLTQKEYRRHLDAKA
ncbi:MAG TPA: DUF2127 domain-containing protein [Candidatus Saccharimonadales bacterium]|nr:DUF2127 domain-containing protein [Candidatus Saccharimonadales bacterium]